MERWEYKRVEITLKSEKFDLEKLGKEGWEMCGIYTINFSIVYYFKKKIDDVQANFEINRDKIVAISDFFSFLKSKFEIQFTKTIVMQDFILMNMEVSQRSDLLMIEEFARDKFGKDLVMVIQPQQELLQVCIRRE